MVLQQRAGQQFFSAGSKSWLLSRYSCSYSSSIKIRNLVGTERSQRLSLAVSSVLPLFLSFNRLLIPLIIPKVDDLTLDAWTVVASDVLTVEGASAAGT